MKLNKLGTKYEGGKLDSAFVELLRITMSGHPSEARQLAVRLTREVPPEVVDPKSFRTALRESITLRPATGLQFTSASVPRADDNHPLLDVESRPDAEGLVLDGQAEEDVRELVLERNRINDLATAGLSPTRTLLLSGPPGVGKTMTSRWLASSTGLPLLTLNLASVVSSYVGTSGKNIRSALDYAKTAPCVLMLDEFDAIGKRRDDQSDIGELKRIVNVVLQELDRWPPTSLLIAATNHPQLLDPAIGRRFERHIVFEAPNMTARLHLFESYADSDLAVDKSVLQLAATLTQGDTGSDLRQLWQLARRRAILHESSLEQELLLRLAQKQPPPGAARDMLWTAMRDRLNMSNRRISVVARASQDTVAAAIRRAGELR